MTSLQQQIKDLFNDYDEDIRQVIIKTIDFEQENIHLVEPRYKNAIISILDHVVRTIPEEMNNEV